MAITTPALGGALPQTTEFEYGIGYRGGSLRMADGSLVHDLVQAGTKRTVTLTWRDITETDRNTVVTRYANVASGSASLTTPDGQTITVVRAEDQRELIWSSRKVSGGALRWTATLRLEEV